MRAGGRAVHAAYALRSRDKARWLCLPHGVQVHRAFFCAGTTAGTGIFVQRYAGQADLVQKAVYRTERAEDLAEKTGDKDARNQNEDKDRSLYGKQEAQDRPQFRVGKDQGQAPFQRPRRAEVLAESRVPRSREIRVRDGQDKDKDKQK